MQLERPLSGGLQTTPSFRTQNRGTFQVNGKHGRHAPSALALALDSLLAAWHLKRRTMPETPTPQDNSALSGATLAICFCADKRFTAVEMAARPVGEETRKCNLRRNRKHTKGFQAPGARRKHLCASKSAHITASKAQCASPLSCRREICIA